MIEAGLFRYTTKFGDKVLLDTRSPDGSQVYDANISDKKMALYQHVWHAYRMRFSDIMPGSEIQKIVDEHDAWIIDPGNGGEGARIGDVTPGIAATGVFYDVDYNKTIDLILIKNQHGYRAVVPGTTEADQAYFDYVKGEVDKYGTHESVMKYGSRFSGAYDNGDLDGYTLANADTPVPSIYDIKTISEIQYEDKANNYIKYETRDGGKFIVDASRNPDHHDAALRALRTFQLRDEGAIVVGANDVIDPEEIKDVSSSDKYPEGMLTFKRGGRTYVVVAEMNPVVHSAAVQVRNAAALGGASEARGEEMSFLEDLDIMNALTDESLEEGGTEKATVLQYVFKKLVEKYSGMELDKNDPRFQFLQAFRAISAAQAGMDITPFVEDVRWEGAHTSRSEGKKKHLTKADMEAFIDSGKAYELYQKALQTEEVQEDYNKFFGEALGKVDDVDGRREKLRKLIDNPKPFLEYIQRLKDEGKLDLAELEIQRLTDTINALLDEDEAADAILAITFGATGEDLDRILEDPDSIDNKDITVVTYDIIAMMLRATSLTTGVVRRTLETLRSLNDSSPDAVAAVFKELQKLYLEVGSTMGDNHGQPTAEAVRSALQRALKGFGDDIDNGKFMSAFLDLNKYGLLGSLVGGIGITTGVMKLTSWNRPDEGEDGLIDAYDYAALATARDFINALSLNTAFILTSDSLLKLIKSGGMVDFMGLAGSLPEVWGENGVLKEYRGAAPTPLADEISRAIGIDLNSYAPVQAAPDTPEAEKANGYVTRALSKLGINTVLPKVVATGVGTMLRVLSSLADVTLGVVDIILGALSLRGRIEGTNSATGGLQIFAGVLEGAAGIAGTFSMFGKGGLMAKAIMTGTLAVALGITLFSFVTGIAMADQDSRFNAQLRYFQDLDSAGLLERGWGQKLEYAMYTLYDGEGGYGSRDAPENISIFDYQWREFEHFLNTDQEDGSSVNRLDGSLRFNANGSDWTPKNGSEINGDPVDYEDTVNTIVWHYANEGIFPESRKLWGFNQDGRPIKPLFAKLIQYYLQNRDADASAEEAASWAIEQIKSRIGNAYGDQSESDEAQEEIEIFMNYVNKDDRNGKKDAIAVATEVIDSGAGRWFNPDDPLEGLSGRALEVMIQRYIKEGIRNSDGVLVYLDPNDYDRKIRWNDEEDRYEDFDTGEVLVWNKEENRYEPAAA
ncbi:hypothetical protein [Agaricicola taiwanensis]|nr:hypothetical protein [Agaricicola taiwanensis]